MPGTVSFTGPAQHTARLHGSHRACHRHFWPLHPESMGKAALRCQGEGLYSTAENFLWPSLRRALKKPARLGAQRHLSGGATPARVKICFHTEQTLCPSSLLSTCAMMSVPRRIASSDGVEKFSRTPWHGASPST